MIEAGDSHQRLHRLLVLVDREDEHLQAVRHRLLGDDCRVDETRVLTILSETIGIDRLESFGAKFGRMQDTVVDKLIPAYLEVVGERVGAAIDNLNRMERLGLLSSADDWLAMRALRNRLVHEYMEQPAELTSALERACRFAQQMHRDYGAIRRAASDYVHVI